MGEAAAPLGVLVGIVGLGVNGAEVEPGADVALLERRHEGVARQPGGVEHLDHVEVPGVVVVVGRHPRPADLGHLGEQLVVTGGQLAAAGVVLVHRRELVDADRRLKIGEVVLEAGAHHLDLRRPSFGVAVPGRLLEAVEAQGAERPRQLSVGQGQHSALGRGHVLDRVEGEDAEAAEEADVAAGVGGADAVRGVLEQPQAVTLGGGAEPAQVAGRAGEMDRQDPHRRRPHRRRRRRRVDLQGVGIDVGEHRPGPASSIMLTDAAQVSEVVTTSSPGLRPRASSPMWRPAVAEERARAIGVPT